MKLYFTDYDTGQIKFYPLDGVGRIRRPRVRAQKLYSRFGGVPFIPFRIAHYPTPAFYYSDLMRHRRKQELDQGVQKIRFGIWRASTVEGGE